MEGLEGLAYDDPQSDSNAMMMGVDGLWVPALSPHTPRHVALHMLGSPMEEMLPLEVAIAHRDVVEVHVDEAELDNL